MPTMDGAPPASPRHTSRPVLITLSDQALARTTVRQGGLGLGCLYLALLAGGVAAWFLGAALGALAGGNGATVGSVLGLLITVAAAAPLIRGYVRVQRDERGRIERDLQAGAAEEITIHDPRVVVLAVDHGAIQPALCIDIGDGKLLLLAGPWLLDPTIFGVDEEEFSRGLSRDEFEELTEVAHLQRLGFPGTQIKVRRLPASGEVLSIQATGDYVAPGTSDVTLAMSEFTYPHSALLEGRLDDLRAALEAGLAPAV